VNCVYGEEACDECAILGQCHWRGMEALPSSDFVDLRGVITTFVPPDPIVEYNLVTLRAGDVRGMHWHPHFTEYLLFMSGEGKVEWRDIDTLRYGLFRIRPGLSTRAVPRVAHAVTAETDVIFVAMLTRRWDDSDPPIVPYAV
jgi:mannose-6-phosphate isomerase-like protein (cupin superfamily)